MLKSFQSQKTVPFQVTNKFYGNKNYPLSDTFKKKAQRVFNDEGENIDLSNKLQVADAINEWVSVKIL